MRDEKRGQGLISTSTLPLEDQGEEVLGDAPAGFRVIHPFAVTYNCIPFGPILHGRPPAWCPLAPCLRLGIAGAGSSTFRNPPAPWACCSAAGATPCPFTRRGERGERSGTENPGAGRLAPSKGPQADVGRPAGWAGAPDAGPRAVCGRREAPPPPSGAEWLVGWPRLARSSCSSGEGGGGRGGGGAGGGAMANQSEGRSGL